MIEMRHLRYFIAAVENGSIRRAAVAIRVEESALSRRIRDLEDRLGCVLLTRSHTGVVPTAAGIQFLRHAKQVTTEIEAARVDAAITRDGYRGEVRVGICFALSVGFPTQVLDALDHAYPEVGVSLTQGGIDEHVSAMRRGLMDVAFIAEVGVLKTLHVRPFWREQLHVVMSESDPLANRTSLGWPDLLDRTFAVGEAPPVPQYHARAKPVSFARRYPSLGGASCRSSRCSYERRRARTSFDGHERSHDCNPLSGRRVPIDFWRGSDAFGSMALLQQ